MKASTLFRKIAPAIWSDPRDPSVYGYFELDVTGVKDRGWILPLFLKSLNSTMQKNPLMSTMVRRGRVVERKDKSISVMVNMPGSADDLSALQIDTHQEHSLEELRSAVALKANLIRKQQDPHLGPMLKILEYVPQRLVQIFVSIFSTLIYDFNTRLGLKFLPLRPFGSVIVSNVGSLGLSGALLPLVPLAKASLMLSVGEVKKEVKVIDEQMQIRDIVQIGVTFDHRLFDGAHAAKMLRGFKNFFAENLADLLKTQNNGKAPL